MRLVCIFATLGAALCAAAIGASSAAAAPPPNDDFAAAELLGDKNVTVIGTTKGATKQAGEGSHAGNSGGASVWYRWKPETDVILTLDRRQQLRHPPAAYTGATLQTLTEAASNDDAPGAVTSIVRLDATAGTEYRIAIDGYAGAVGAVSLTWSEAQTNDDFDQAQTIAGEKDA